MQVGVLTEKDHLHIFTLDLKRKRSLIQKTKELSKDKLAKKEADKEESDSKEQVTE